MRNQYFKDLESEIKENFFDDIVLLGVMDELEAKLNDLDKSLISKYGEKDHAYIDNCLKARKLIYVDIKDIGIEDKYYYFLVLSIVVDQIQDFKSGIEKGGAVELGVIFWVLDTLEYVENAKRVTYLEESLDSIDATQDEISASVAKLQSSLVDIESVFKKNEVERGNIPSRLNAIKTLQTNIAKIDFPCVSDYYLHIDLFNEKLKNPTITIKQIKWIEEQVAELQTIASTLFDDPDQVQAEAHANNHSFDPR